MNGRMGSVDVAVVGGGQAGLATGYHLQRLGIHYQILESLAALGEQWRQRWDSLRLFTPARYSHLPGLPLPLDGGEFPSKDQLADHLAAFARHFDLSVRTGVRVTGLTTGPDGFSLSTSAGLLQAARDGRCSRRRGGL